MMTEQAIHVLLVEDNAGFAKCVIRSTSSDGEKGLHMALTQHARHHRTGHAVAETGRHRSPSGPEAAYRVEKYSSDRLERSAPEQ